MRRLLLAGLLLLAAAVPAAASEYYKVTVRRVAQDLYKTDEGVYIKTRWCYEYAYGEEAILKYEGPGAWSGSQLIFPQSGGSTCDVEKVLR